MKNIFTLAAVFCLAVATAWSQSAITLAEVGGKLEVQIKLGAGQTSISWPWFGSLVC